MRKTVRKFNRLGSHGDTIVEVLISLSIISLVLVAAYATASHSSRGLQDTQEHGEALSIARAQVEYLRQNKGLDTTTKGCFDINQAVAEKASDGCRFAFGGGGTCTVDSQCYTVDITKDPSNTYKVSVTWEGLRSDQASVSLWYRVLTTAAVASAGGGGGGAGAGGGGAGAGAGGGGAGAGGDAAIGSDPLPCAPNCTFTPPAGGHYQFSRRLINLSKNDPANVKSCEWDWGDGTKDVYSGPSPACIQGGYSDNHQYAPPTNLPPYPGACYLTPGADAYRQVYTVTLKVDLFSGGQRTDTYTFGLPDCVP